jgi:hypothetical protein
VAQKLVDKSVKVKFQWKVQSGVAAALIQKAATFFFSDQ